LNVYGIFYQFKNAQEKVNQKIWDWQISYFFLFVQPVSPASSLFNGKRP